MGDRRSDRMRNRAHRLRRSPLTAAEWNYAVKTLGPSPQQAKIVELILRGLKDKQIAAELELGFSTVRTYLDRIFMRLEVADRVELVLRVFTTYVEQNRRSGCPQKC